MAKLEIDITSSIGEKAIDAVKGFLAPLIKPTIEEVGFLFKEHASLWRLKNQVKILEKAKVFCEKNNISPSQISLKLLCPLLEHSSLEEDDFLQDKWAILLSNLLDSEQNIQNQVFPYILGQIGKNEFVQIEGIYLKYISKQIHLKNELVFAIDVKNKIFSEQEELQRQLSKIPLNARAERWPHLSKIELLNQELRKANVQERNIETELSSKAFVEEDKVEDYELSNLNRLGIIRQVFDTYAYTEPVRLSKDPSEEEIDLDINVESTSGYILTQLGEMFIKACQEKQSQA